MSHLILTSSFGRTLIPFDPPLNSFSEARERLVAMHELCLKELDVEGVMLERYVPPNQWWQWCMFALTMWTFTTLPFRASLLPESRSLINKAWSLGGTAPWLARLAYQMSPLTLAFMIVVHGWECYVMGFRRLRRYEVEVFSWVWWCWVLDVWCEGFGGVC